MKKIKKNIVKAVLTALTIFILLFFPKEVFLFLANTVKTVLPLIKTIIEPAYDLMVLLLNLFWEILSLLLEWYYITIPIIIFVILMIRPKSLEVVIKITTILASVIVAGLLIAILFIDFLNWIF